MRVPIEAAGTLMPAAPRKDDSKFAGLYDRKSGQYVSEITQTDYRAVQDNLRIPGPVIHGPVFLISGVAGMAGAIFHRGS